MAPSVQRRIENAKQSLRGRSPYVFEIRLVPQSAEGIPVEVKQAAFLLQRQSKQQSTEFADVRDGLVSWDQVLRQESTFYKEGDTFAPKEFSLKLQGLKGRGKNEKPQTFAKMELDMASYCSCSSPGSRDLIVKMRPKGRLHVAIEVTWMQNRAPDMDALSRMSLGPSLPSSSNIPDQDLSGFDDNIKAVHGTPSKKRVSFQHSLSMPVIRDPGSGQTPARRALSRTSTTAVTPGEGFLSRRSTPCILTDSSTAPFNGFPAMPAVEEDLLTPSIQRRSIDRPSMREPIHRKSKSLPASTPGTPAAVKVDSAEEVPKTPLSPSDSNIEEIAQALMSSDEEDEGNRTLSASVKRWWTGSRLERRSSGMQSPFAVNGMRPLELSASADIDLENVEKETDIEKLREVCRKALRDCKEQAEAKRRLESRVMHLERDKEVLEQSKQGMAERLSVAEDRLARVMREDVMKSLAAAKLQLAQADFDILELQGELHSEKMRNKTLRYTLMNMQDDSLSALNKALIPVASARNVPARIHSSSQEEDVSPSSSVISRGSLEACQELQHKLPVSQTMCWSSPNNSNLPMPAAVS